MSDLVELQVPKEIILASETITKENASKYAPARVLTTGETHLVHRSDPQWTRAAGRHGRLRVHGRRALTGVAHREPRVRPAGAGTDGADLRPRRVEGRGRGRASSAGTGTPPTGATLIARDDIDVVDICTPGDSHAEIAIAALAAGKHVLCEKPLANTVDEARAMVAAAAKAQADGVRSMCGFNYRRVPAVALMRQLVASGRLGVIRHVRAVYLQDWIVDPQFPLVWRLQQGQGGLRRARRHRRAHHRPDPVRHRPADHRGQRADRDVRQGAPAADRVERPGRLVRQRADAPATGQVTVDDAALFLARLDGGAIATYEASRFATGRKNGLRVEINGSLGSAGRSTWSGSTSWSSTTRRLPPRSRASTGSWSPRPTTRTWRRGGRRATSSATSTRSPTRCATSSRRIATGADPTPSFADALQVQLVLDAVARSAEQGTVWTDVEPALAEVAA